MSTDINVAGVWKDSIPSINVAGVWKTCDQVEVNVAGVWKDTLSSGPSVSPSGNGDSNYRYGSTCYAGVQFNANGTEYEYTASGSASSNQGAWLDSGLNSQVWVLWTRTGGTLSSWNSLNPGTVRRQLSTTRSYRINRTTNGTNTISGYFRMYDAASSGNLLWTGPTATWSADADIEGCPLCCFTPETPVTLASGLEMPIGKVRAGDLIATPNGPERVGEVLIREQRAMFRIQFEDGRYLDASDDHPLEVEGKGASSINPNGVYKDLGIPETLNVGDVVRGQGRLFTVTAILPLNYPGKVYTFTNSPFYANGVLVY